MSGPEREVWGRFLDARAEAQRPWTYELELGAGSFGPGATPPSTPEFYLRALKKRVDAAVITPEETILAEVKEVGGMAALGQLLTYRQLLWDERKPTGLIALWVVCGRVDYDVRRLFELYSVRVFEV
jgi:hypothetical protein